MSLAWQKQLLFKDYSGEGEPEKKKGNTQMGQIDRPHGAAEKKQGKRNRTCHMCLFVNQWIWWQALLGNLFREFLNGINIEQPGALLTFPFLSSPQLTRQREGGTQSVNADSARAAINKVSLLFTACPEHHPEDRRAFYHLKGSMQTAAKQQRDKTSLFLSIPLYCLGCFHLKNYSPNLNSWVKMVGFH